MFPVAPADGSKPAAAAYHPTVINVEHCLARRTSPEHGDRRWSPMVYMPFQCPRLPVRDSDLCETCKARAEKAATADTASMVDGWHGRVTDAAPPATSHIAGSEWFNAKPVWRGTAKPQTAKQRSPRHKATPWNHTDMAHVIDRDVSRDLYRAIEDNVISAQLLRDGVCMLLAQPVGSHHISWRLEGHPHLTTAATRKELADLIYHLLEHPETEVHCQYKESEVVRLRRLLTENGIAV
jgi:hypothetical protein